MQIRHTYIGVKKIEAEPMWRHQYNRLKNEFVVGTDRLGYHVIYPDGYESWSPKDVFESAYFRLSDPTKITLQDVQAFMEGDTTVEKIDERTTLVQVKILTGFRQYETSSCVDPENYDHETGKDVCLRHIQDRLWPMLGFVLKWAQSGLRRPMQEGTAEGVGGAVAETRDQASSPANEKDEITEEEEHAVQSEVEKDLAARNVQKAMEMIVARFNPSNLKDAPTHRHLGYPTPHRAQNGEEEVESLQTTREKQELALLVEKTTLERANVIMSRAQTERILAEAARIKSERRNIDAQTKQIERNLKDR